MPNYVSKIKPDGMGGTEYNIKDAELREVVQNMQGEVAGTQTATGNPITITDAAPINAESLVVELKPKQDLHGYDFPWVGGAGKNKLPVNESTITGLGWIFNTSVNLPVGTWTFSFKSSVTTNLSLSILDEGGNNIALVGINNPTRSVTFTINAVGKTAKLYGYVGTYYDMQIESGSTATTFAPYSNICPITGYTEVGVEDVGKNFIGKGTRLDGYINAALMKFMAIANCVGYYFETADLPDEITFNAVNGNRAYYGYFNTVPQDNADCLYENQNQKTLPNSITVDKSYKYIHLQFSYMQEVSNVQVEKGQTATTYEPYQSRTATIPFSQTLYGGESDFVEGGTENKLKKIDLGDLTWYYDQSLSRFYSTAISDKKDGLLSNDEIMCSCFKPDQAPISGTSVDGTIAVWDRCYVKYFESTDATEFKTMVTGQTLTYPLATTTTLSTPPTDLKLLQGTNNITTNGTTITLDYIPNNSIGDAVKASEEYTDRAVERVAPKATLIDTWMISEESDTISVDLSSYDCNFFLFEYLFQSKRGTTLIPRPQGGSFSASVVTYNNGSALYIELTYNPTTKELAYTSNITSQFGILAIYTI